MVMRYNSPDEDLRFDIIFRLIEKFNGNVDLSQVEAIFQSVKGRLVPNATAPQSEPEIGPIDGSGQISA